MSTPDTLAASRIAEPWTVDSWRTHPVAQAIDYPDKDELRQCLEKLRHFPPLVTSWEVENLRLRIQDAAAGRRFVLHGGDCAETFADCTPDRITNKLKILLQMSLVLAQGLKRPIVRIGRIAGQYAKPRSSAFEKQAIPDGSEKSLVSYYGDLINGAEFTDEARRPDPQRLVKGFKHSAITLNFIRGLIDGGFADMHHPEYWNLAFLDRAGLPTQLRESYRRITEQIANAVQFMEAVGEQTVDRISRPEFYTSHEGLNLEYESALTRQVPRRVGHYNLSCHLPWIGERTRQLDGAHVEFFRGIRNPIGMKIGPKVTPDDLLALAERLDPYNEPGRLVVIARFGAGKNAEVLPPLLRAMRKAGRAPLWMCDPMHANTFTTSSGIKTRHFDRVLQELAESIETHRQEESILGGVHVELTGENVTECVGGASGVSEKDLNQSSYETLCDPRLNYEQAMELAFAVADRMATPRRSEWGK